MFVCTNDTMKSRNEHNRYDIYNENNINEIYDSNEMSYIDERIDARYKG